jgi:hypothetical protein
VLGSVAAELVRRGSCSLLIVPGSARTMATARAAASSSARTRSLDSTALDKEFAAFTTRNAERRCSVEIDALDFGAQMLGHDLPLVGASFEGATSTATFMFGASALAGHHLAHSVGKVVAVDLSTASDGRDQVLRLVHGSGQTLITMR